MSRCNASIRHAPAHLPGNHRQAADGGPRSPSPRGVPTFLLAVAAALAPWVAPFQDVLVSRVHAAGKPIQVVTTTEDLAAIAREVGGARVAAAAICPGYRDPHFVDAKPSYMVQLKRADVFVQVGRDLEVAWAPGLLNGARNPRILPGAPGFVDASSQVEILEIPVSLSRAQGDVHPFGNPHYWLDPENGPGIARSIRDGLARVSPADAPFFQERCADFERRVTQAAARWREKAEAIGLTGSQVVTYHRTWSYFARAFGFEVVNYVEPRPGIPPSPNHVQDLVTQMKRGGVRLLVMEDFFDPRLPRKISRDTGVPLIVLPTSVGAEDDIKTYFDLFERLLDRIEQASKATRP